MLPALFIAHGAPLLAIEDNEYTQFLSQLGKQLPKPKAIVLFSAHWESNVQQVSSIDEYSTIYDFGAFSEELFRIQYPAKGSAEVTKEIQKLFKQHDVSFAIDGSRGLDHGAWVVLRLLYPNADIPVVSMSINRHLSPEEQYQVGKTLACLREKDVLVIGSGGTVHNLRALNWSDNGEVDDWALEFDEWLATRLENWDVESLFNYSSQAPGAQLAVPPYGNEHFVPLFYAMGAADNEKSANLLHRSYRYGNLSHSVWQFGS
ncbi:DODA-type extradiol aromatic ring-opening family dioxygenase [Halalkalibacter alkalisediminis]|uniref:DODA-type extradiol aromatic ring-opening family dioxygenase n=1 Tax=Halalkalibacter alkalisediminis TaxID=935616 RepID=A0ABV6NM53_9BACI|nr:class III extradiol ring-cleavage dioxygenase [Halalkalibacter alkalisediminis]